MSRWFYRQSGDRFSKFRNENNLKGLSTEGLSIAETNLDAYKVVKAVMKADQVEGFCRQYGITVTAEELILQETVFGKLEIRETFDGITITEAVPEIPATETAPAVPAVAKVTLGDLLNSVLDGNKKFAIYWADADQGIDITYPTVVEALSSFPVPLDINALKLAILANRQKKAK
jgi:hypothetical protein